MLTVLPVRSKMAYNDYYMGKGCLKADLDLYRRPGAGKKQSSKAWKYGKGGASRLSTISCTR